MWRLRAQALASHKRPSFPLSLEISRFLHAGSDGRQEQHTSGVEAPEKEDGRPFVADRCKILLHANWRGQLTTVTPKRIANKKETAADRRTATFVNYIFFNRKAVIFLPGDSPHCANLLIDSRASLIVGHTDTLPLMKAFQSVKKVPPHAVFVGALELLEDDEVMNVDNVLTAINEQMHSTKQAADGAGPTFQSILEDSGHVLETRVHALSTMLEYREEDAFYQLDVRSIHLVDPMGNKHAVQLKGTFEGGTDPISPLLAVIVDGINLSNNRRLSLRMFCLWYLRVKAVDAYIFSADRCGLDILAKVLQDSEEDGLLVHEADKRDDRGDKDEMGVHKEGLKSGRVVEKVKKDNFKWKEFRLNFSKAANDVEEFCLMLSEMERVCVTAFRKMHSKLAERSYESG